MKRLQTEKSRTLSGLLSRESALMGETLMPVNSRKGHPSLEGAAADLRDRIVIDFHSDKDKVWF